MTSTLEATPAFSPAAIAERVERVRETAHVVRDGGTGTVGVALGPVAPASYAHLGTLPPLYPEWLGDRAFGEAHGVRFPYVAGEMANGIAAAAMVEAMAGAEMLGFFGSAGLELGRLERELAHLQAALGPHRAWGANLIHAPHEPSLEARTVELFLAHGVRRVSASAFMSLTPAVVRYAATGLRARPDGTVSRENHLFAKISRPEVARHFLAPAPAAILDALVAEGLLSPDEAALARRVPLAGDLTVESDSGGHTDNRPLGALFPTIAAQRDAIARQHGYAAPPRLGAAGGIATPASAASAFALGAAYVLTGSINQAAREAGLSDAAKAMLGRAELADVVMAPAGDMFELGVKVQVLRRGTMFAARAQKLWEVYSAHDGLASIPGPLAASLERDVFKRPLEAVWRECEGYFARRDPSQLTRAEGDPKHRMALVFRWYLGQSSRWAIAGDPERALDYQIWTGPAQGAFNAWAAGSFLEPVAARGVVAIALNLLEGAAVVTRAQQLRTFGVPVPAAAFDFRPRPLA